MGYNLGLGCLTCRERAFVPRGREAPAIKEFGALHWRSGCRKVCSIDNGYEEPDWNFESGWNEISLWEGELDERIDEEQRLMRIKVLGHE